MATFDLLPAIDLRGGRVVRLRRGDFGQETAYSDDPVEVARAFLAGGARWLHVVDLNGARDGRPAHDEVIRRIVVAVGDRAAVEVAGGLRSADTVLGVLGAGVARVVVGTAALTDPPLAEALVSAHGPDRIVVAVDVRDDLAVGDGWVPGGSTRPVMPAVARLVDAGVRWFEFTAIDRDGTMAGPDLGLLASMAGNPALRVIAAGGIRSMDDLEAVRGIGCAGAIVGRALYDGTLDLATSLSELEGRVRSGTD